MNRRTLLKFMGAASLVPHFSLLHAATEAVASDALPSLATVLGKTSLDELYAELQRTCASAGRDLRSFGAKLDGVTDDTAALERALASDARAIIIAGDAAGTTLRLTRQIRIERPVILAAQGTQARILWQGKDKQIFLAATRDGKPEDFLQDVWIDGLAFENAGSTPRGHVLRAINVRGLRMTRCKTLRVGGAFVTHARDALRLYDFNAGSKDQDPAVIAGFSARDTDDLNQNLLFADNHVDGGAFMVQALRFQFVKGVAVVRNTGTFANVSWWGGGAMMKQGGNPDFLRRVENVYIADNKLDGALGGIYGNNGRNVLVERNEVSRMMDAGIDFEGCIDATARKNVVRNCGNFCYSVFFCARNVRFIDNVAMQDGSGENMAQKLGASKAIGKQRGRTLFAMRSSGFGGRNDAITVELSGNSFTWSGPSGLGGILPSYAGRVTFSKNTFRNVTCDLRYRLSGESRIINNNFLFDRAAESRTALVAVGGNGNMGAAIIAGNHITVRMAQPAGTSIILANTDDPKPVSLEISGNTIVEDGDAQVDFPIFLDGPNGESSFLLKDNQVRAIFRSADNRSAITEQGNHSGDGRKVGVAAAP